MKIYNKKNFWIGIYFILLAAALFAIGFQKGFSLKDILLIFLCFVIGACGLMRSFSKELSRKDQLLDLDERNRLILLKSSSRANCVTQVGSVICMGVFFGISLATGAELMKGAGIGACVCLALSLWGEFFARLYYEKKN